MDEINKRLGRWGRYQGYVFGLCFLPSFLGGCHTLISSFTFASPENRCLVPGLDNQSDESYSAPFQRNISAFIYLKPETQAGKPSYCQYCPFNETNIESGIPCTEASARSCDHGRIYDTSQYKSTLSMEFDMVCERAYLRELLRPLFMAGVLTGGAVFGFISDKIGRKPTFVLCSLLEVVIFNIFPFALNYYVFSVLQFIGAAIQFGSYLTGFIISVEMIDGFPRTIAGVGIQAFFTIGYLYVGFVAYMIRSWRWLQFSVSILTLLYLPYYWLLPESIRWLLVNGKRDQAQIVLNKACKMNRIPQFEIPHEEIEKSVGKSEKKTTMLDLFRNRRLAGYTIIIFFTWLVCSLTYYGLAQNTADLPGNDYVNFILSGIFELPGLAACIPAMERFGRKPTMIVLLTLSGIACILSGLLPSNVHAGIVASATIGKMCIAGAFAVIYCYTAEIFPSVVRNTATGFSSFFARIGSMLAPQIHLLSYYVAGWVPIVVYGVFALAAAVTDFFLTETKGRPMPETIQDTLNLAMPVSRKNSEEMRSTREKSPSDTADHLNPLKGS